MISKKNMKISMIILKNLFRLKINGKVLRTYKIKSIYKHLANSKIQIILINHLISNKIYQQ